MYGRSPSPLSHRQIEALGHPVRFRILQLFINNPGRSLAVADLAADLGDDFEGVSLARVNYHLRHLQRVDLIPGTGED